MIVQEIVHFVPFVSSIGGKGTLYSEHDIEIIETMNNPNSMLNRSS